MMSLSTWPTALKRAFSGRFHRYSFLIGIRATSCSFSRILLFYLCKVQPEAVVHQRLPHDGRIPKQ